MHLMILTSNTNDILREHGIKELVLFPSGEAAVELDEGVCIIYDNKEDLARTAFKTDLISLAINLGKRNYNVGPRKLLTAPGTTLRPVIIPTAPVVAKD